MARPPLLPPLLQAHPQPFEVRSEALGQLAQKKVLEQLRRGRLGLPDPFVRGLRVAVRFPGGARPILRPLPAPVEMETLVRPARVTAVLVAASLALFAPLYSLAPYQR